MKKKKEFLAMTIMDSKVYLMSINLRGIHNDEDDNDNNVESCIKRKGKLISVSNADGVDVLSVFHCSGLLLCPTKEKKPRLVVWNPFHGQTRWIKTTYRCDSLYRYSFALGYEKKKKSRGSLKILRCTKFTLRFVDRGTWVSRSFKFEIYHFNSDSWKEVVGSTPYIPDHNCYVSLKGNTYWLAHPYHQERFGGRWAPPRFGGPVEISEFFLVCFDFTMERFGPRLLLPFHSRLQETVSLSSVRDKQLAVLYERRDTKEMEIWITTKINPKAVSWRKLLAVNMKTLITSPFNHESFFVDEEEKVVVVFGKAKETLMRNVAYIIGEDGSKKLNLGDYTDKNGCPLCSYLPSSLQIE